jgi:hypothetical protein
LRVAKALPIPHGKIPRTFESRVFERQAVSLDGVVKNGVYLYENRRTKLDGKGVIVIHIDSERPATNSVCLFENGDVDGKAPFLGEL